MEHVKDMHVRILYYDTIGYTAILGLGLQSGLIVADPPDWDDNNLA